MQKLTRSQLRALIAETLALTTGNEPEAELVDVYNDLESFLEGELYEALSRGGFFKVAMPRVKRDFAGLEGAPSVNVQTKLTERLFQAIGHFINDLKHGSAFRDED